MRGPEPDESFALLKHPAIAIAQIADGPPTIDPDTLEWEAGIQRLLPGQGAFNIPKFINALSPNTPISIETPQQNTTPTLSPNQRAQYAVEKAKGFCCTEFDSFPVRPAMKIFTVAAMLPLLRITGND